MYDSNIYRERRSTPEEKIRTVLDYLSVAAHLKGYKYLEMAIKIVMDEPDMAYSVMKGVFPKVAARYETNVACVERAIRNAIAKAWERGNFERQREIFGQTVRFSSGRPTDAEFIAIVANLISSERD